MADPLRKEFYAGFCRSLLDVTEVRQCFAEEIVLRRNLRDLYAVDFLHYELADFDDWKSQRPDLFKEAKASFRDKYPKFEESVSRLNLYLSAVKKLDGHLSGREQFKAGDILGGDPYVLVEIDGLFDPIRFGSYLSVGYSDDTKHLDEIRRHMESDMVIRQIQRQIFPLMDISNLDSPEEWGAAIKLSETRKYWREFERNHLLPSYINSEESFTLELPPRGCRIRAAASVLSEAHLPERILHLFGIALYETEAMIRFFRDHQDEINVVSNDNDSLIAFIGESNYWASREVSKNSAETQSQSHS